MKQYCVDLEIAKELKINGFTQNTEFYYSRNNGQEDIKGNPTYDFSSIHGGKGTFDTIYDPRLRYEHCSALTTDEILKELPNVIIKNKKYYYLNIFRGVFNVVNPAFTTHYYEITYIDHNIKCLNSPDNLLYLCHNSSKCA